MARTARTPPDDGGEIKPMDFPGAVKLWKNDIKPALTKAGESNQEAGTAYKEIKKACNIQPQSAKAAFKCAEMEDAHYEDYMRGFIGILTEMGKWPIADDLVDRAQRETKDKYARPKLVTLPEPDHPDDDSDLANPDGEEPTEGTGAAAIAAMRAADAEQFDD